MKIDIIIPTWQEESALAACLAALVAQAPPFSVTVVDAGSTDATVAIATQFAAQLPLTILHSPERGRAAQMNWGAAHTQAPLLLFLHADSLLPATGLAEIRNYIGNAVGGRFRVRLDVSEWPYPLISWGINTRSQITGAFTGDMGIFVRRDHFEAIAGFPDLPLMEDLAIASKLPGAVFLPSAIVTSSRRWRQGGVWRTIALMQVLRLGYRLGVAPSRLQQWYRSVR